ncbi:MAG: Uma2 family endonuclease [Chloroflexi bacterium]|nr:Uma2 family endonuclease [Chloroflexota bacterium]
MIVERVGQMSVEEYLDFVEQSEDWYEYIDGKLHLMTSTKFNHNAIGHNLGLLLGIRLADTDCQVLSAGQGIRAGEDRYLIPDLSVVCGEPELEDDSRILLNPTLVVEVTSPSSIDHDRVVKRDFYEAVESIQAYLVVDQHRMLVELYTRSETGWHLQTFGEPAAEVPLEALACSLPLRDIYRRIEFEDQSSLSPREDA